MTLTVIRPAVFPATELRRIETALTDIDVRVTIRDIERLRTAVDCVAKAMAADEPFAEAVLFQLSHIAVEAEDLFRWLRPRIAPIEPGEIPYAIERRHETVK